MKDLTINSTPQKQYRPGTSLVITAIASMVALAGGFYMALIYAPEEAIQGGAQRIFYLHVPALWVGALAFLVVFISSLGYLFSRNTIWDIIARSSAEMGVIFLTLGIVAGAIWARPIWGIWYSFDPRGTNTLVLWLTYVSYIMLRSIVGSGPRTSRLSAFLGIVGFINVPLVFMATRWWRTLHPAPTIVTSDSESGMPQEMFLAFLVCLGAFTIFYAFLMIYRVQLEQIVERVQTARSTLGLF